MPLIRRTTLVFCLLSLFAAACQKDDTYLENAVPKVTVGPNLLVTADSASLAGSASDSDGRVVAYLWSQVSGPAGAVIGNPGSATTMVRHLNTGLYQFQLMATDNKGATGVSMLTVDVKLPSTQTLTLQPATNPGEYQLIWYNGSHFAPSPVDFPLVAWTKNSDPFNTRGLLKFDLSSIPASATILSAQLYLYSYPSPTQNGNQIDANSGTSNGFYVKQITANWNGSSPISWSNEPATTTTNQVYIPSTEEKQLDLNLDLKAQVAAMVANNANYGFYLKLENEIAYNCRLFVSSFTAAYPNKHPKLVVTYK